MRTLTDWESRIAGALAGFGEASHEADLAFEGGDPAECARAMKRVEAARRVVREAVDSTLRSGKIPVMD